MATTPAPDVALAPVGGDPRPIADWVTTFHLAVVALDPFTHESAWILDTAGRIMREFTGADCRVAWLVAADDDQTAAFLGPWGEEFLTFADPDRVAIKSLGVEALPAFVHIDQGLNVRGAAEGWQPAEWKAVAQGLAEVMSWSRPTIPGPGDPTPYAGTPV